MIGCSGYIPAPPDENAPANRRRCGRIRIDGIPCSLGVIEDISGSGMRIRSRKRFRQGEGIYVDIRAEDEIVRALVRVAWIKKEGLFGGSVIGAQFVDASDDFRRAAMEIARKTCAEIVSYA